MPFALLDLTVWECIVATLTMTHVTIVSVTLYLHRCQTHRAVELHPVLSHFFRFWLWLTTGSVTRQWVAIHRRHHARVDTAEDPHSPQILGIGTVLLKGREVVKTAFGDPDIVKRYGYGTPDDWIERNVYARHDDKGYRLMLIIDVVLFGPIGLTIWAVQMMWIPVLASGVVNGIGHWRGYRNYDTPDASTNVFPWGLLIGGEELHNNHHAFPSSARLSRKWWELDLGWGYLRLLCALGLARVKEPPPQLVGVPGKTVADLDTVEALVANRVEVMAMYQQRVLTQVHRQEVRRAGSDAKATLRHVGPLLRRHHSQLAAAEMRCLESAFDYSNALETAFRCKLRLEALWLQRSVSHEELLVGLQQWCQHAEATGIDPLRRFAETLPSYTLALDHGSRVTAPGRAA